MSTLPISFLSLFVAVPALLFGGPITISFDGLADSTILASQYSGVTFSNAIILTAGVSLNEFEFPPRSGVNVASDNGGPMSIAFSSPVLSFGGYFTYSEPVTLTAFDPMNNQVASVFSLFSSNDALFGDPGSSPNELLQVAFAGGISRVAVTGDPAGGSFALDDAAYALQAAGVPEPSSLSLVGLVLLAAWLGSSRNWAVRAKRMAALRLIGYLPVVALTVVRVLAAPGVGNVAASPSVVFMNTPTVVTFTVGIHDPTLIPASINLLRLGPNSQTTILGMMRDDGLGGDILAGDGVYTLQSPFNESGGSQIDFQVSIAFKGSLVRMRVNVPTVFVQQSSAPAQAISNLAATLQVNNISSALPFFSDLGQAAQILPTLDAQSLANLALQFSMSQLTRVSGDLRIYTSQLGSPPLKFALAPDDNGNWQVVIW